MDMFQVKWFRCKKIDKTITIVRLMGETGPKIKAKMLIFREIYMHLHDNVFHSFSQYPGNGWIVGLHHLDDFLFQCMPGRDKSGAIM